MAHAKATMEEHPATPRVLHWLHLLSIIILAITGIYISSPFVPWLMSLMRGTHFFFMWLLIIVVLIRVIWAFVGKSAPVGSREPIGDYKHFGPQKENKGTLGGTIAYYLFLRREAPVVYKYNGLQKGTYIFWLLLIVAQAITGFALWTPTELAFQPMSYAMGGLIMVRTWHYIIMWVFLITTALHVYLSSLHRDELSVMIMGREPDDGSAARKPAGSTAR